MIQKIEKEISEEIQKKEEAATAHLAIFFSVMMKICVKKISKKIPLNRR